MNADAPRSTSARERMRDHRRRRRLGVRCVRVLLSKSEIDALIQKGWLPADRRYDQQVLEGVLDGFVHEALGDS
jgi:hypothetical protein